MKLYCSLILLGLSFSVSAFAGDVKLSDVYECQSANLKIKNQSSSIIQGYIMTQSADYDSVFVFSNEKAYRCKMPEIAEDSGESKGHVRQLQLGGDRTLNVKYTTNNRGYDDFSEDTELVHTVMPKQSPTANTVRKEDLRSINCKSVTSAVAAKQIAVSPALAAASSTTDAKVAKQLAKSCWRLPMFKGAVADSPAKAVAPASAPRARTKSAK